MRGFGHITRNILGFPKITVPLGGGGGGGGGGILFYSGYNRGTPMLGNTYINIGICLRGGLGHHPPHPLLPHEIALSWEIRQQPGTQSPAWEYR